MDFETLLTSRSDEICAKAYELLCALVGENNPKPEWDMSIIGDLVDLADERLLASGIHTCNPFYESDENTDPTPCYLGQDCKNPMCPMKKQKAEAERKCYIVGIRPNGDRCYLNESLGWVKQPELKTLYSPRHARHLWCSLDKRGFKRVFIPIAPGSSN